MHSRHFYVIILSIHSVAVVRVNLIRSSTSQSRPFLNHNSSLAIDGNPETCSITDPVSELAENSWWLLELDTPYYITDVKIFVASDAYGDFIKNLKIYASKSQGSLRHSLCATFIKANYDPTGYNNITCKDPHFVKFIMIERFRGPLRNMLVLCEVRLYAALKTVNLALHRPTEQSGVFFKNTSQYSVDGNFETCTIIRSFSNEFAWWRVILDNSYYITNVNMFFLPNSTGQFVKKHVYVYVSNEEDRYETNLCGNTEYPYDKVDKRGAINITCTNLILGSSITIKKFTGARPRWLILCEVQVFSRDLPKEMNMSGVFVGCLKHEYRCNNDRCITKDWLCDGIKDCPEGDDESSKCEGYCKKGKFKCLKRDLCVKENARCDGTTDCHDFSDEHSCFQLETETDFLTATRRGVPGHYVCSHGWKKTQSFDVCRIFGRKYLNSFYVTISDKMERFIIITRSDTDDLPSMKDFRSSSRCQSGKIIKVQCELPKKTETESMCGTRGLPDGDFQPYIIKGLQSKNGAWPWHAQIFIDGRYVCGGSIVKNSWILTSAHCFMHKINSVHVMVDTNVRDDPNEKKLPASHIVIHPKYDAADDDSHDDIALVRLKEPLIYSKRIRPICLPDRVLDSDMFASYRYCLSSGFGHIDRNNTRPKYLQHGRLNRLSATECLQELSDLDKGPVEDYIDQLTAETFCAGSSPTIDGINICKGDSGGPYVCKNERRIWTLIGVITSTFRSMNGLRCTLGLFTKVDHYLEFIHKVFHQEFSVSTESNNACTKYLFDPLTYSIIMLLCDF